MGMIKKIILVVICDGAEVSPVDKFVLTKSAGGGILKAKRTKIKMPIINIWEEKKIIHPKN